MLQRSALSVLCLVLSIFMLTLPVFAGDNDWKPVSPAELALKESSVEKDADAEAIFWEVRVDDSSVEELALKHYLRVKIFTERGREKYSKVDVPFAKGRKIRDLMARIIRPDGAIIELKKEDIFEREIAKANGVKVKAKSFAVPNIEPGVIFEYRYREVIDGGAVRTMPLVFQREIPIQTISYLVKPFAGSSLSYQSFNMEDAKFVKDKNGFFKAELTKVPSYLEEPNMPPEDSVRSWMLLYDSTYRRGSDAMSYWAGVSGLLSSFVKEGMKPNDEVKKTAVEITAGVNSPEEKLDKLYEFVQINIKNTAFDFSLTEDDRKKLKDNKSAADTLKRRTGTAADVDLLFGAMARAVGFETRLAMTGDRSEFFFNPRNAHQTFIHPAAIAVKVNNDYRYYNPGSQYLPSGMLVWFEESQDVMVIGEKEFLWTKTPLTAAEKSMGKRTGKFKLSEDGTLEGEVRIEYTGHLGITRKLDNDEDSPAKREESLKEEIKSRIGTAELSGITVENVTESVKPFVYTFKVKVPNYAQKTGKRLFLQPNFFEYGSKPRFTGSARKHEIYFNYPWSESDEIKIELPAGYVLESPDAPPPIADPQKIGSNTIQMFISADKKTLTYKRKFHFGGGSNILFPTQAYPAIKNMFEAFHKNDTHSLILKQDAATATNAKTN